MITRKFVAGGRYRHDDCLDMDLEIQKISFVGPNYTIANVVYLNRNWQQGNFVIDKQHGVKLVKEHYKFWKRIP